MQCAHTYAQLPANVGGATHKLASVRPHRTLNMATSLSNAEQRFTVIKSQMGGVFYYLKSLSTKIFVTVFTLLDFTHSICTSAQQCFKY